MRVRRSGCRRSMVRIVTLLPEPDSPTSATVVFSGTSKLMPTRSIAGVRVRTE